MKKFLIALIVVAMSMTAVPAFAQAKIAVIDLQRSVMTSAAGQKASEEMRAFENTLTARLEPLRAEYTRMESEFRAQEQVLAEAARRTRIDALQRKAIELETAARNATAEAQRKNDELLNNVFRDLERVIAEVAKKGEFDLVLHRQTVAFSAAGITDITDAVIAEYNRQFNAAQAPATPQRRAR
jgi:outer membrane protein